MILVDTSVWIEHLRSNDNVLRALLNGGQVLIHPFVLGELALGSLQQRQAILNALENLPKAVAATDQEVLHFINRYRLSSRGVGYIDTHLLAATKLSAGASFWTRDKGLRSVAKELGLASDGPD